MDLKTGRVPPFCLQTLAPLITLLLFALQQPERASTESVGGPISLEINRKSPADLTLASLQASHHSSRRLSGSGNTAVGSVTINNCENVEYTAMISIGTPAQEFSIILNTGSYWLWVASASCVSCTEMNKYDSSLSTTFEAEGEALRLEYSDGTVASGIMSIDTLNVGGLSTTVSFGEMLEAELDTCSQLDGIMGMGLSNEEGQNAFEDMVDAGVVDLPIFSFYLGNIDTGFPTGVLTLGGVDQTHYEGCLEWVDVSEELTGESELLSDMSAGFWSVILKDVKVGSESVLGSEAKGVIDTASSLIVGPSEDVGALAEKIGATCVSFTGLASSEVEQIDCVAKSGDIALILMECTSEFDDINFYFGGDDFALTAKELLQPLDDFGPPNAETAADPWCIFGMIGSDIPDTWILGDSFLRTFYTAYNVEERKVGLAQATNQRQGVECAADAALGTASSPPLSPSTAASSGSDSSDVGDHSEYDDDDVDGGGGGGGNGHEGEDLDTANAGGTGGSSASGNGNGRVREFAVGAISVLASIVLSVTVVALVVFGRRRWARGHYRLTQLGGGGEGFGGAEGGSFEMAGKGRGMGTAVAAARHGGEVPGPEEDFLQAKPREDGSKSSFYRGFGDAKRVVRTERDDAEGEEEDGYEDEVDVDLRGRGGRSGRGAVAAGGKPRLFGRFLSGQDALGFAGLDDDDEGGGSRGGGVGSK